MAFPIKTQQTPNKCGHFGPHPAHTLLARERASSYYARYYAGTTRSTVHADLPSVGTRAHAGPSYELGPTSYVEPLLVRKEGSYLPHLPFGEVREGSP